MRMRFGQGYGLLIGVNENYVDEWALPDVARDVGALKEVLVHPERCAYLPEHVRVVTGAEATRQGILDGLDWLRERLAGSSNGTAVIYYSGHGLRQGEEYYLIPYDVRRDRLVSRSLRAADFAAEIEALAPRRMLVLLDCCHSGGMGVKGAARPYVPAAFPPALLAKGEGAARVADLAHGHGRAVLCSSTGGQRSYMRPDRRMSLFTYHLIEALTGHAQPQGGAEEVLVSDLVGHVTRRVPESARAMGVVQEPDFVLVGNFPVALLLGGKGLGGRPAPDPLEPLSAASGGRIVAVSGGVRDSVITAGDSNVVIQTGGGAYVGGNVQVEGDFVGRDVIKRGGEDGETG